MKINYSILEKKLNLKFRNKNLLIKSLTHKSYNKINNNEKIEFLGDRVLGLVIAKKLLEIYPNEKEGVLDKKFASLVNKKTCLIIAKDIELEKFILTYNLKNRNFKIQNIVASAEIPHTLKLLELSRSYGPYVSYEPDLFPGLVFRTTAPKLVFLLFRSGKIVITGAKNRKEIESTFSSLFHGIVTKFIDYEDTSTSSSDYRAKMRRRNFR